jgi:hypothetical protein
MHTRSGRKAIHARLSTSARGKVKKSKIPLSREKRNGRTFAPQAILKLPVAELRGIFKCKESGFVTAFLDPRKPADPEVLGILDPISSSLADPG